MALLNSENSKNLRFDILNIEVFFNAYHSYLKLLIDFTATCWEDSFKHCSFVVAYSKEVWNIQHIIYKILYIRFKSERLFYIFWVLLVKPTYTPSWLRHLDDFGRPFQSNMTNITRNRIMEIHLLKVKIRIRTRRKWNWLQSWKIQFVFCIQVWDRYSFQ